MYIRVRMHTYTRVGKPPRHDYCFLFSVPSPSPHRVITARDRTYTDGCTRI